MEPKVSGLLEQRGGSRLQEGTPDSRPTVAGYDVQVVEQMALGRVSVGQDVGESDGVAPAYRD